VLIQLYLVQDLDIKIVGEYPTYRIKSLFYLVM